MCEGGRRSEPRLLRVALCPGEACLLLAHRQRLLDREQVAKKIVRVLDSDRSRIRRITGSRCGARNVGWHAVPNPPPNELCLPGWQRGIQFPPGRKLENATMRQGTPSDSAPLMSKRKGLSRRRWPLRSYTPLGGSAGPRTGDRTFATLG